MPRASMHIVLVKRNNRASIGVKIRVRTYLIWRAGRGAAIGIHRFIGSQGWIIRNSTRVHRSDILGYLPLAAMQYFHLVLGKEREGRWVKVESRSANFN